MFGKFAIVILAVAMAPALATLPKTKSLWQDDTNYYYTDNLVARNRVQAEAFCKSNDAALAIVDDKNYRIVTAGIPAVGNYWIDGMDSATGIGRFSVSAECSGDGTVVFTKTQEGGHLDIPVTYCLNIVKGTTGAATKIQAVPCTSVLRGVICSFPKDKCANPAPAPAP